jgi:hypothetical protein
MGAVPAGLPTTSGSIEEARAHAIAVLFLVIGAKLIGDAVSGFA